MRPLTIEDLEELVDCKSFSDMQDRVQAAAHYAREEDASRNRGDFCEISVYCDEIYITLKNSGDEVDRGENMLIADKARLESIVKRIQRAIALMVE